MAKRIRQSKFNVYAIGTRKSAVRFFSEELSWWSNLDETVIGAVVHEKIDNEYLYILLARDEQGRFRCSGIDIDFATERRAEAELRIEIEKLSRDPQFLGVVNQYDESRTMLDLLMPIDSNENLHPSFYKIITTRANIPARRILKEIGPWLYPEDKHFVREFQCHQFDQRLWELYLWASFREMGYDIKQHHAPDFQCTMDVQNYNFTVEATTLAETTSGALKNHPNPKSTKEFEDFLNTYMPIKFGSSLTSKLNKIDASGKYYWEHDHSKNKPFIIAIADFHHVAGLDVDTLPSMVYSQPALYIYLYGHKIDWFIDDQGKLNMTTQKVDKHNFEGKEIPSGFFDLPNSENISGVLFSNAGTISKFDRMGVCAGFAPKDCKYIRQGMRFNSDPNATIGTFFIEDIESPDYVENWADELQLFHNPNAKYPILPEQFPNITHHNFIDGEFVTIDDHERILSSMTYIFNHVSE